MKVNMEHGMNWDVEAAIAQEADLEAPEQELARAVITLAFEDVNRFMRGRKVPSDTVRDALDFLTERGHHNGLETWCIVAGLDVERVRKMVQDKLATWNANGLQEKIEPRGYTQAEEDFLRDFQHKGVPYLARELGRTEKAIKTKLRVMYLNRDREAA